MLCYFAHLKAFVRLISFRLFITLVVDPLIDELQVCSLILNDSGV